MTPRETAAFNAGIQHAANMALVAAATIEARDDAGHIRQCAAAAALQGLAEGLRLSIASAAGAPSPDPQGGASA